MKKHPILERLQQSFDYRIERMERLDFNSATDDKLIAYVLIETLNAWASFAREFYLSCVHLNAKTRFSGKVAHSHGRFGSERDALLYAIAELRPHLLSRARSSLVVNRRDEPTWHEPRTITELFSRLSASNLASVNAALSYSTTFFRDAPPVRNFFAHRNEKTFQSAAALATQSPYFATADSPADFMRLHLSGRPGTVLKEWMEDIRLISHVLCE